MHIYWLILSTESWFIKHFALKVHLEIIRGTTSLQHYYMITSLKTDPALQMHTPFMSIMHPEIPKTIIKAFEMPANEKIIKLTNEISKVTFRQTGKSPCHWECGRKVYLPFSRSLIVGRKCCAMNSVTMGWQTSYPLNLL